MRQLWLLLVAALVQQSTAITINDGKLTLEKLNTDENICIKGGLIRDLIGYSMHENQDTKVKELIKYLSE